VKIFHSLKFKITGLLSVFIIILIGITSVLGIRQMSKAVTDTFAAQGDFIAERVASFIDGDSFEALVKSQDINDPFYEEARINLFLLKNSSGAKYLYLIAPLEGDTWQYIIDGSAEPDDAENFSNMGDEDDTSSYDDAFKRAWTSGKVETDNLTYQGEWGWLISFYMPIKNSAGRTVGIATCDYDGEHLHNIIIGNIRRQVIIGIISIVVSIVLALFFTRFILMTLNGINSILIELGEGNLTRRIENNSDDEIGDLMNHFNITIEKIRNLIGTIKFKINGLNHTNFELSANMGKTSTAVSQISSNLDNMKNLMVKQENGAEEAGKAVDDIKTNIDNLNKMIEEQTESVNMSSTAIEEMTANIHSVTQTLVANSKMSMF